MLPDPDDYSPDELAAYLAQADPAQVDHGQAARQIGQVPPHSVEAEQALLGAILFKSSALAQVVDMVRPDDFYLPAHQLIFSAFLDLHRKNHPVDLPTALKHHAPLLYSEDIW